MVVSRAHVERRVSECLRSLKRLPVQIDRGLLPMDWQRSLLDHIGALPDSVDPLIWISESYGDVASRIVLQTHLNLALHAISKYGNFARVGFQLPPELSSYTTSMLKLYDEGKLPDPVPGDVLATRDVLAQVMYRLRDALSTIGDPASISNNKLFDPVLQLLMRLPPTSNPVDWLGIHRARQDATEVSDLLLSAVIPNRSLSVGTERQVIRLDRPIAVGRLTGTLERLVLGSTGFRITGSFQLSHDGLRPPDGATGLILLWVGFEQAWDNLGATYIQAMPSPSAFNPGNNATQETLQIAFYPAIQPTASAITLQSSPLTLQLSGTGPQTGAIDADEIFLTEELQITIPLAIR
jgi:hypothetical protein